MPEDRMQVEALKEEPATQLVKDAIDEARALVKLEVALAKNELKQEVKELKRSAIGFGVAAVGALMALSMMLVALVLALGATWWVALIVAGVMLVIAGVGGMLGYNSLPKEPLGRTRQRLSTDLKQLKERVA